MKKFTYDFSVPADTSEEADVKMKAIKVLASRLTARELDKLADTIQNNPVKTALAKKYLGV
jgi:hypothetical protein